MKLSSAPPILKHGAPPLERPPPPFCTLDIPKRFIKISPNSDYVPNSRTKTFRFSSNVQIGRVTRKCPEGESFWEGRD